MTCARRPHTINVWSTTIHRLSVRKSPPTPLPVISCRRWRPKSLWHLLNARVLAWLVITQRSDFVGYLTCMLITMWLYFLRHDCPIVMSMSGCASMLYAAESKQHDVSHSRCISTCWQRHVKRFNSDVCRPESSQKCVIEAELRHKGYAVQTYWAAASASTIDMSIACGQTRYHRCFNKLHANNTRQW